MEIKDNRTEKGDKDGRKLYRTGEEYMEEAMIGISKDVYMRLR